MHTHQCRYCGTSYPHHDDSCERPTVFTCLGCTLEGADEPNYAHPDDDPAYRSEARLRNMDYEGPRNWS